jgi:hypothetical protein
VFLTLPVLALVDYGVRFKYVQHVDRPQRVMLFTIIPYEIYNMWDEIIFIWSYFVSFCRPNRAW